MAFTSCKFTQLIKTWWKTMKNNILKPKPRNCGVIQAFGSNIFWTTGKMHSNLRTDQFIKVWCELCLCRKQSDTETNQIKRKTGQQEEALSRIQNNMQCKGAEHRLGEGGWWRRTSNWPHCGFSQTLYIIAQFLYKHRRCDREEKSKGGHGFYLSHLLWGRAEAAGSEG